MEMARHIVQAEARRTKNGALRVYPLPQNDGGGAYEVAGINERFHGPEAEMLKKLVENGQSEEAEQRAIEYIAKYTDVVGRWTDQPALQAYLRDTAFNRGPTGAAIILQRALGVEADGSVGATTIAALRKAELDQKSLLKKLGTEREKYEGVVRGNFKEGLNSRWESTIKYALEFLEK